MVEHQPEAVLLATPVREALAAVLTEANKFYTMCRPDRNLHGYIQAVTTYFTVSWVAIGVIGSARGISEEQYAGEDEQQPAPASDPRNAGARARETRPYGRGSLGRGGG